METEKLSSLNVRIPTELHKQLKIKSIETGKTMTNLTVEYLERCLSEDKAEEETNV